MGLLEPICSGGKRFSERIIALLRTNSGANKYGFDNVFFNLFFVFNTFMHYLTLLPTVLKTAILKLLSLIFVSFSCT